MHWVLSYWMLKTRSLRIMCNWKQIQKYILPVRLMTSPALLRKNFAFDSFDSFRSSFDSCRQWLYYFLVRWNNHVVCYFNKSKERRRCVGENRKEERKKRKEQGKLSNIENNNNTRLVYLGRCYLWLSRFGSRVRASSPPQSLDRTPHCLFPGGGHLTLGA